MDLPAYQLLNTMNEMDMMALHQEQLLHQQRQPQQTPSNYQQYYQSSPQMPEQTYQQQAAQSSGSTAEPCDTSVATYTRLPAATAADIDLIMEHTSSQSAANSSTTTTPSYNGYYTYSNRQLDGQGASTPQFIGQRADHKELQQQQQEDLTTPLISPSISPSFVYQFSRPQLQQANFKKTAAAVSMATHEVGFSPLSSPAIQPQVDNYYNKKPFDDKQQLLFQQRYSSNGTSSGSGQSNHPNHPNHPNLACSSATSSRNSATIAELTDAEIEEQYEQLEQAKRLITQKLTALQQKSQQHELYSPNSTCIGGQKQCQMNMEEDISLAYSSRVVTPTVPSASQQQIQAFVRTHGISKSLQTPTISASQQQHAFDIKPATPSSLMNMRLPSSSLHTNTVRRARKTTAAKSSHGSNQIEPGVVIYEQSTIPPSASASVTSTPITSLTTNEFVGAMPIETPATNTAVTTPISQDSSKKPLRGSVKKKGRQKRSLITEGKKQKKRGSHHQRIAHPSPRALKPLLVRDPLVSAAICSGNTTAATTTTTTTTTTTNAGTDTSQSANSPSSNSRQYQQKVSSSYLPTTIADAERILATKSNYQNLIEGKAAALGIAFKTEIKSGVEVRRSAHKVAEQKRRDSLKEWFDRLRCEVENGYVKPRKSLLSRVIKEQQRQAAIDEQNSEKKHVIATSTVTDDDEIMNDVSTANPSGGVTTMSNSDEASDEHQASAMKPLSKVLLLQYAYEYITHMKGQLEEKEQKIKELKKQQGNIGQ